jgi:hypothetical protein
MGACCYYNKFHEAISDRKAYEIQTALDDMEAIHNDPLPPPHPIRIPHDIRLCTCRDTSCICPINYDRLTYHILRNIQYRIYCIKGSSGYHHSSERLAYLIYLATQS